MKIFCAAILLLAGMVLSSSAAPDFGGPSGELAQLFRKTNGTNLMRKSMEAWWKRKPEQPHGITEIGLERTRCYGRCPAYTFIVQSNGAFRYTGTLVVQRMGSFTGKIEPGYFDQIARFIRDSGFMDLEDEYDVPATDSPTTYTSVVLDGQRKLIRNYANAGPSKLWAIEQLIDELLTHAKWDEPAHTPPTK